MKPYYYVEYDEVDKTYSVFVTDYEESSYDLFIADFEDISLANSIRDCLNDVIERCWG